MGRPQTYNREDFIRVALKIVDAEGLEALTLRRLGSEVGASATAAYTHFNSREDLVSALVNELLKEMVTSITFSGATPHDKLMEIGQSVRTVLLRHPYWVSTFLTVATDAEDDAAKAFQIVVGLLEEAGLSGKDVVVAYRILESFMFGLTAYDLGRAPDQHVVRRRRYKRTRHPAFVEIARSERAIALHSEEAFTTGLSKLLTALGI